MTDLYDALQAAIRDATDDNGEMGLPELIGTIELVKSELITLAMEPDEEGEAE